MTAAIHAFPPSIHEDLKIYVYRLIDPRNGETFYVGKGKGNRVFDHANGKLEPESEYVAGSMKERINEILTHGHQVTHVIHRHGLTNHIATEIEAALIDAYPGLTNLQLGAGSKDRGVRHTDDIIRQYAAPYCELLDPLILICINKTWRSHGVYEGTRGVWKINIKRASKYPLVLARVQDLIVGVFEPERWMAGTVGNFPLFPELPNNWGFVGSNCRPELEERYLHKRLPPGTIKKGAMAAVRYNNPDNLDSAIVQETNIPVAEPISVDRTRVLRGIGWEGDLHATRSNRAP